MIIFRQLLDPVSSTYTYLVGEAESGEAVLIDPVFEHVHRDTALLRELGLHLVATLETHIHADHVTGAWLLKQQTGCQMAASDCSGSVGFDRELSDGEKVLFGQRFLEVRATPGHTDGCLTFVLDDHSMAFTGDCLLIRGCGRTDFQQGNAARLFRSVHERILTLPDACLLYPAHDYRGLMVTSVAEERQFNPRLGGQINESDFAGYMGNLGLAHPKLIDVAVPANLRCGRPESAVALSDRPSWAPLTFTFAGVWEIAPNALEEHAKAVQLVDVREPSEFSDALGEIAGSMRIPLSKLSADTGRLSPERPVVTVCRSGARSTQAAVLLNRAGFSNVANLAGGMLRWRAEGHRVEGAPGPA
jgi:glyoxylase-like metal-dependent hydrolase (beta-lactamase superfamily II)/rhodanese-related sulfurtransferase